MSRRAGALFALMSVVWGVPYLLIKVAVHHLSPVLVVEGRTLIGAAVLLPLAARQGQLRPVLAAWKPLLVYTVVEMAVPWLLLSTAEERLPSSLSGLLVATVPLFSLGLAVLTGRQGHTGPRAVAGVAVGLVGVGVLLGLDVSHGALGSVAEVIVVAIGYSIGPLVAVVYMSELSSLALAAASLTLVALAYLPVAVATHPARVPPGRVIAAVVVLGLVCTAVAFVAFFELLRVMPTTQATLITYFNPVVAVALGVALLGETFRVATVVGLALILAGSYLATRSPSGHRPDALGRPPEGAPGAEVAPG